MSGFIGKYVCWGDDVGMFCWGRIKAEVVVNTADGLKEAFILDERMSGGGGRGIQKHNRDTILQKDRINVERDVFDRDVQEFESISNDDLFLLMMDSDVGVESMKVVLEAISTYSTDPSSFDGRENVAADLLRKRMETIQDDVLKV